MNERSIFPQRLGDVNAEFRFRIWMVKIIHLDRLRLYLSYPCVSDAHG